MPNTRARGAGLCLGVLAVVAGACDAAVEHPVPEEGAYEFVARHPLLDAGDSATVVGYLVITDADPGQVQGRWEAEQLHVELTDGGWKGDAYEVEATPVYQGKMVYRITPVGEGEVLCSGTYSLVVEEGERTVPILCLLRPAHLPAPAAEPNPGAEVRPIDADTAPAGGLR